MEKLGIKSGTLLEKGIQYELSPSLAMENDTYFSRFQDIVRRPWWGNLQTRGGGYLSDQPIIRVLPTKIRCENRSEPRSLKPVHFKIGRATGNALLKIPYSINKTLPQYIEAMPKDFLVIGNYFLNQWRHYNYKLTGYFLISVPLQGMPIPYASFKISVVALADHACDNKSSPETMHSHL